VVISEIEPEEVDAKIDLVGNDLPDAFWTPIA